jgi:hypothetical protein
VRLNSRYTLHQFKRAPSVRNARRDNKRDARSSKRKQNHECEPGAEGKHSSEREKKRLTYSNVNEVELREGDGKAAMRDSATVELRRAIESKPRQRRSPRRASEHRGSIVPLCAPSCRSLPPIAVQCRCISLNAAIRPYLALRK